MPNQSSLDVATILELEQELARAWLDGDRAFIETLLAPDWATIDVTGRVLTKEQVFVRGDAGWQVVASQGTVVS